MYSSCSFDSTGVTQRRDVTNAGPCSYVVGVKRYVVYAQIYVWYDNEFGYSCRMVDILKKLAASI